MPVEFFSTTYGKMPLKLIVGTWNEAEDTIVSYHNYRDDQKIPIHLEIKKCISK